MGRPDLVVSLIEPGELEAIFEASNLLMEKLCVSYGPHFALN
jgi:hypothetical protein